MGVTSPTAPTTPPTATGNASLWQSSATGAGPRPVVFFYGAEFAPYAAAERWPVVVALSRFGTFSALGLMQSSSSVAFSDTPTFTFWQVHYTSIWVDLQAVERYSSLMPNGVAFTPLQTPTARQAASVAVYDTSAMSFPLLDIANHYVLVGSSFSPSVLGGPDTVPGRGRPGHSRQPRGPGRPGLGQRDHRGHLHGDRPEAHRRLHAPAASTWRTPKWASTRPVERRRVDPPQLARRSSTIFRSTSLRPPHMPCGSRIRMAYSRQSPRTRHWWQISLARSSRAAFSSLRSA